MPYPSAVRAWRSVHEALGAAVGAHGTAAEEMKSLVIAPLKERVAASDAQRERMIR